MSSNENPSDRQRDLRESIRERYRAVADTPTGHFPYSVGYESALGLGYEREWIDALPREIVERFVGVGNPSSVRCPVSGDRVLDIGCGCGLDTYLASRLAGQKGKAVGIDLSPAMLAHAKKGLAQWPYGNLEFHEGSVESLPFVEQSFDLVVSNGALNLVPDKDRAYREIFRVLCNGGILAVADLLVIETIPDDVLADIDAWST